MNFETTKTTSPGSGVTASIEGTFGRTHDLISTVNHVISSLIGDPPPEAGALSDRPGPNFGGNLGSLVIQAQSLDERLDYTLRRVEELNRAAG